MTIDQIKELGTLQIDYDRQIAICGQKAADNVLHFWMMGYRAARGETAPYKSAIEHAIKNKHLWALNKDNVSNFKNGDEASELLIMEENFEKLLKL